MTVRQSQQLRQREPFDLELPGINDSLPVERYKSGLPDVYEGSATKAAPSGWILSLTRMLDIEKEYGHTFLFVPVFLVIGAVIWFSLSETPSYYMLIVSLGLTWACSHIMRYRMALVSGVLKVIALCLVGMLLAQLETWRTDTVILDTPVTTVVTGIVERRELDAKGYWRYIISVSKTENPVLSRPPTKISALSRNRHQPIPVGSGITGRVRLSPPSGPALAGLNDFAFAAYFNGIGATGFFYGAPKSLVSDEISRKIAEQKNWLNASDVWLYKLRSAIAQRIRSTIGGDAGAFAASIITDERRAISQETMEALRVSGLAHIVAISGLNMALASGIFFVGFRMLLSCFPYFAQRWPVKKIAAFAALLMTLAYYLISGFAVSAERAWLMMSIMLIAVLFDRPSISLRNVAISAIVIICFSPSEVMGPSFQMSFAATIALVSGYAFWSRRRSADDLGKLKPSKLPAWLKVSSLLWSFCAGIIVTSIIGGVSTAIYSMEHFHRVTTYGLAANLAAMPVMSFIVMPFALIAMLLMPFGLDGPFLKVMGYGMSITIDIAKYVAAWGGDAGVGRQHEWFLGIATIGFLILTLFRTKLAWGSLAFLLVGLYFFISSQTQTSPDLIIFEDGKLIALVGKEKVATTNQRPSGFVYDQWARALPLPERHSRPVMLDEIPALNKADDEQSTTSRKMLDEEMIEAEKQTMLAAVSKSAEVFTCRKNNWCVAKSEKGPVVVSVIDNRYVGLACDIGNIVVTSRYTSFEVCRSGALLLSVQTLRRTGSLEITFSKSDAVSQDSIMAVKSMNAAAYASYRPWTVHRYYNWYTKTFETNIAFHVSELLNAR